MYRIACINLAGHSLALPGLARVGAVDIAIETHETSGSLSVLHDLCHGLAGTVEAICLVGGVRAHEVGGKTYRCSDVESAVSAARDTPVFDGSYLRSAWEPWALRQLEKQHPGLFNQKRILLLSGIDRPQWARFMAERTPTLTIVDPILTGRRSYALKSTKDLEAFARLMLPRQRGLLFPPGDEAEAARIARKLAPYFAEENVLAAPMHMLRRFAPDNLTGVAVVTDAVGEADQTMLAERGAMAIYTVAPSEDEAPARLPSAVLEAALAPQVAVTGVRLQRDAYMNFVGADDFRPGYIALQPEAVEKGRFAFVIHPLSIDYLHQARGLKWTRIIPDRVIEPLLAHAGPMYLSRITGPKSRLTGREVEGYLFGLAATPKEMMRRKPSFIYRRLVVAARMAERMGARIMGLGAFTSVVGDAGVTVAHHADIAITSGNSLTVAATLETAKQVAEKMGHGTDRGRAVIIGATGSIGAVCARLLAQAIYDVVLVAPRPERLIELKQTIERETPEARVTIATSPDQYVGDADLVITTTSAATKRVVDVMKLKPGCVVCDIARPPDIPEEDAEKRDDVLIIESGEIRIPGNVDFGYNIGLPPQTAYACLAETCLLAMEGIYEDYSVGRELDLDKVKRIYRLFKKHGFELAGIRSFGRYVSDEEIERIRERALAKRGATSPPAERRQEAGA